MVRNRCCAFGATPRICAVGLATLAPEIYAGAGVEAWWQAHIPFVISHNGNKEISVHI